MNLVNVMASSQIKERSCIPVRKSQTPARLRTFRSAEATIQKSIKDESAVGPEHFLVGPVSGASAHLNPAIYPHGPRLDRAHRLRGMLIRRTFDAAHEGDTDLQGLTEPTIFGLRGQSSHIIPDAQIQVGNGTFQAFSRDLKARQELVKNILLDSLNFYAFALSGSTNISLGRDRNIDFIAKHLALFGTYNLSVKEQFWRLAYAAMLCRRRGRNF